MHTSHRILRVLVLLCLAATGTLVGVASPTVAADRPAVSPVLSNSVTSTGTVLKFDVDGEAIDAHSPDIVATYPLVDGVLRTVYYLYGDSYGCGWTYNWSTTTQRPYCGVNIYSSTDLRHWKKVGPAITDLGQAQPVLGGQTWKVICASGCFRPKVIYNSATRTYVMWINVADRTKTHSSFAVLTSSSPAGPFTAARNPQLVGFINPSSDSNGDQDLFVDTDGTAWIAYTRITGSDHWAVIERLSPSYMEKETRTGRAEHHAFPDETGMQAYPGAGSEGPILFKRDGTYYIVSGPTCPYCSGTSTYYMKASSLRGPWSTPETINGNSCFGQQNNVIQMDGPGSSTYLYLSDQWQGGNALDHNIAGTFNQALAGMYFGQLYFESNGDIDDFGCLSTVNLYDIYGSAGSDTPLPSGWQGTDISRGFQAGCDLYSGGAAVVQTFTPQRAGTLTTVWISAYQRHRGSYASVPNKHMDVWIQSADANGRPTGPILGQKQVTPSEVDWAPGWVKVGGLNIPVTQQDITSGRKLDIVISSGTTTGCYGLAVNNLHNSPGVPDAYPGGSVHTFSSGAWHDNPLQDYNFRTNL